jgi:hypothetical protein
MPAAAEIMLWNRFHFGFDYIHKGFSVRSGRSGPGRVAAGGGGIGPGMDSQTVLV